MARVKKISTPWGVFDSKAEAERYKELMLLEKGGIISGLTRQVEFDLTVNGEHIGYYTVDFVYVDNGEMVAEEFKGFWRADARLRAKLFMALYGKEYRYRVTGCGWRKVRKDKGRKRNKSGLRRGRRK